MAYSDYGGYAYRNGERVEDRSDAVLTPELANLGEPGIYPGFVAIAQGQSPDQFEAQRKASVDGHVVLGDGPVFVAMYKQTSLSAYVLEDGAFRPIDLLEVAIDLPAGAASEYEGKRFFSGYCAAENDVGMLRFEVAGHVLEALFEISDNWFHYARLTQPDGAVWTAFSGYGVGAGLEDCGYGSSTDGCVDRLFELFPRDSDGSGEAGETGTGSTRRATARAEGIALNSQEKSS